MPDRHYIQKFESAGEPYVHTDDLAGWISALRWESTDARRAAEYIAQELRLMGLSDVEESLR